MVFRAIRGQVEVYKNQLGKGVACNFVTRLPSLPGALAV